MRTDILQQAQAIRASMDAAAIVLTDEQAAKAPRLYPTWAAGMAVQWYCSICPMSLLDTTSQK